MVDLPNPVINTQNITPPVSPIGIPSGINYTPIITEGQGIVFIPQFILMPSGLNGQAVYHYPNENGTYPLKYATLRLLVGYGLQDDNGNFINDYGFGNDVPDGVFNGSELAVTNTDENGNFRIPGIRTGRLTIRLTYLGYKDIVMENVISDAGKEVILNIEMEESSVIMGDEVVITATKFGEAINEMAANTGTVG